MGNVNCLNKTKQVFSDYIVGQKEENNNNEVIQRQEVNEEGNLTSLVNVRQAINSEDRYINDYHERMIHEMDLIKYRKKIKRNCTFHETPNSFDTQFLKDLNDARKDLLGFSNTLMDYANNFEIVKRKLNKLQDEELTKTFQISKNDIIKASKYFKDLHEENVKNKTSLNEVVENEHFKIVIPSNPQLTREIEYFDDFMKYFTKKYKNNYKLLKIKCTILVNDPDISFILFVADQRRHNKFLFEKDLRYLAIDYLEIYDGILLLIFSAGRDC